MPNRITSYNVCYTKLLRDPALALDAAKIYIVGDGDISSITVDYTDGGNGVETDIAGITDANSATYGTLTLPNADYSDLRYNARYSPDFPIEGPLYTRITSYNVCYTKLLRQPQCVTCRDYGVCSGTS